MRLYVQDRHTEEMAIFLWRADKCREHTHSPLRSQVVRLSRGSSSKCGDQAEVRQQFNLWHVYETMWHKKARRFWVPYSS